ncbi:ATP-binding protein [Massilia pinisoli]|uniref:histidine kinase n=1 Tax=Massilia pinisoli TaxID=1772194 RepID=A0ABT1ZLX0_9BURK|nr:ATP-binding protein [Massilia pinisoli]MCS0580744.1 ATP-binding protein [Massilia pinisoli]
MNDNVDIDKVDASEGAAVEAELLREQLSMAQAQLLQSEKLASIGQLAAGVAHEINNPISFVFSNFGTLQTYVASLLRVLARYEEAEPFIADADVVKGIADLREEVDLAFLQEDVLALMAESRDGIERVRKIVQDLKDFSRVDVHQQWQWADLHQGIDSTLNIVNNEVKYKADIVKEYGTIPEVECLPSQINQVIMNIVVNGAQAIEGPRGRITIRTGESGGNVWIEIADNGCGIPQAIQSRIFDPFFTTKPIGTGTGLGLSLSYGIIQKHRGRIDMQSEEGVGTTFRIELPIRQPDADDSTEKLA